MEHWGRRGPGFSLVQTITFMTMQPLFDDGKNHKNDDLKKLEQVLIFKFLMNVSLLLLDFYSYNNNMLYIS